MPLTFLKGLRQQPPQSRQRPQAPKLAPLKLYQGPSQSFAFRAFFFRYSVHSGICVIFTVHNSPVSLGQHHNSSGAHARAGERGLKAVRASQTQNLVLVVQRERRLNAAFLRIHQITDPIFAILPGARAIDRKFGELGCRQTIDVCANLCVEDGFDALKRLQAFDDHGVWRDFFGRNVGNVRIALTCFPAIEPVSRLFEG